MLILGILGAILFAVGFIWLILVAFRASAVWGLLNVFFQPIAGFIFCISVSEGWKQFLMMIGGAILLGIGFAGTIVDVFDSLLK